MIVIILIIINTGMLEESSIQMMVYFEASCECCVQTNDSLKVSEDNELKPLQLLSYTESWIMIVISHWLGNSSGYLPSPSRQPIKLNWKGWSLKSHLWKEEIAEAVGRWVFIICIYTYLTTLLIIANVSLKYCRAWLNFSQLDILQSASGRRPPFLKGVISLL